MVSGGSSMISMATPIARWVSLCLDKSHQSLILFRPVLRTMVLPDEISGQLSRIIWQAGRRQPPGFVSEMKRGLQWNTLIRLPGAIHPASFIAASSAAKAPGNPTLCSSSLLPRRTKRDGGTPGSFKQQPAVQRAALLAGVPYPRRK